MIRHMTNITQDTLKIKYYEWKTEAAIAAYEMNKNQPAARPWRVSKPSVKGYAVMSINDDGFLIYISV